MVVIGIPEFQGYTQPIDLGVQFLVLKSIEKTIDAAMTTTRLTQLPTECVTGLTLDKIM